MFSKTIFKFYLKKFIPPIFFEFRYKIKWVIFKGSFKECSNNSTGYDEISIAKACLGSAEAVFLDKSLNERDGVVMDKVELNTGLLSALLFVEMSDHDLKLVDFGGGFGTNFMQLKKFLPNKIQWVIVEQKSYVDLSRHSEISKKIKFFETIEETFYKDQPNVILLSSVLQYLEDPYEFLVRLRDLKFKYIIFDRLSCSLTNIGYLTKQTVDLPNIKSSYPCWFFNYDEIKNILLVTHEVVFEWESGDRANVPSKFRGVILRLKNEL